MNVVHDDEYMVNEGEGGKFALCTMQDEGHFNVPLKIHAAGQFLLPPYGM